MKNLIVVLGLVLAVASGQASVFAGQYKGKGSWSSEKDKGSYDVVTTVNGTEVSSEYTRPDGTKESWSFQMIEKNNKFFTVNSQGMDIGEGYCLDHAMVCHYSIKINDFTLEETIVLSGNNLYKYGSKNSKGLKTRWEESLSQ